MGRGARSWTSDPPTQTAPKGFSTSCDNSANAGGNIVNTPTYDKAISALLVVDPYNDFISEGGKIWPRISCGSQQLHRPYAGSSECRTQGEASSLLCHASSLPSGRLRDVEIHRAYPEGSVATQGLRIRH